MIPPPRMTHKNLPRCGAQAPGCFLPKGSWGQLSKSAILASKLLTPGPKPLLWSELELGHLIEIAFIPKTWLACVVMECQCFPSNTCLQCPTCVSIQEGHFYSPRLNQPRSWNSPQEWRRQADVFENRRGNNRHNYSTTVQLKGRDCTRWTGEEF